MSTWFCTECFDPVPASLDRCPSCGAELDNERQYEEKLIGALSHRLPDRRVMAARILGELRSVAAIPQLAVAAKDRRDPYLAAEAIRSLAAIEPEHPVVREAVANGSALERAAVRSRGRSMWASIRRADGKRRIPVGYHDLLRDLKRPGCPVCRGAARSAWTYLDAVLWESVNDPGVREHLRRAHGFCREHALMALRVANAQANGLGIAIIAEDVLSHVRFEVEQLLAGLKRGRRRRVGQQLLSGLAPHGPCRPCLSADETAANYLRLLALSTPGDEIAEAAHREDHGLCLPHLRAGLTRVEKAEQATRLVDLYSAAEEGLRLNLAEFQRKQDYRFQHEGLSKQQATSWIRAVHQLVGGSLTGRAGDR